MQENFQQNSYQDEETRPFLNFQDFGTVESRFKKDFGSDQNLS